MCAQIGQNACHPTQEISISSVIAMLQIDLHQTMVAEVHWSGHVMSRQVPAQIMGSMVKVWPGFMVPTALFSVATNVDRR